MNTVQFMYKQTIDSLINLNKEYEKELTWAREGTHKCAKMSGTERWHIISSISDIIENNDSAIEKYRLQMAKAQ